MCFSASASFTASAVLAVIGVATLRKALLKNPRLVPLGAFPLLFAIQQAAEGINWLHVSGVSWVTPWVPYSIALFVWCATILWPILMPTALFLVSRTFSQKIITVLCIFAGIIAAYLARHAPTLAQLSTINCHLLYGLDNLYDYPQVILYTYVIATMVPWFTGIISFWYSLHIAGLFMLSVAISMTCIFSVWCFFAALLSLAIYRLIDELA